LCRHSILPQQRDAYVCKSVSQPVLNGIIIKPVNKEMIQQAQKKRSHHIRVFVLVDEQEEERERRRSCWKHQKKGGGEKVSL